MKRFLIIVALLLAATTGIAALLLSNANVQHLAETVVSARLGRDLRIEGEFSLKFGTRLQASATSLRLENPSWADEPNMFEAERVTLAVDLWSIFGDGPLVVEGLEIVRLVGNLVWDESGRVNWDFGGEAATSGINLLIRELDVNDAMLTLQRPDSVPLPIRIETLRQSEAPDGLLETDLSGEFNGRPITASGQLGPFHNLLQGKNVRVSLDASMGALQMNASGLIDNIASPRQPTLKIDLSAPDAGEIAEMMGFDRPIQDDVELQLDIEASGAGINLTANGRWGPNRFDARGRVNNLPELEGIEMSAAGTGPNLGNSLQVFGLEGFPNLPFRFTGNVARNASELNIRELAFNTGDFLFELKGDMRAFPTLNDASLGIKIRGPDLGKFREAFELPGLSTGPFSAQGRLDRGPDGSDRLRLEAETELGQGTLTGTLGPGPDYVGSRVTVHGNGRSLHRLGELLGVPGLPEQSFAIAGELERLSDGIRIVDEIKVVTGDSSLSLSGVAGTALPNQGTKLSWRLNNVDIADLSSLPGLPQALPSRQLNVAGRLAVGAESFLFDAVEGSLGQVEFTLVGELSRAEAFQGSDARFTVRGPDLQRLDFLRSDLKLPAGAFDASGRVQRTEKGIWLSESRVKLPGVRGRLDGELALPTERLRLGFDIALEGQNATEFLNEHVDAPLPNAAFVIEAKGTVNDASWRIDEGLVRLGATEASLSGAAQRTDKSSTFRIRVESPNISELSAWYGLDLPAIGVKVKGTLERTPDVVHFKKFTALSDKGDFAGNLSYTPGRPPRVEGALTSNAFDLSWLLQWGEQQLAVTREVSERRQVIPDWQLPLAPLRRLNAKLSIRADSILLHRESRVNSRAELVLQDGALRLAPLSLTGDDGNLEAKLSIEPRAERTDLSFQLVASELYTGFFTPGQEIVEVLPKGDWSVDLRSRGDTLRDLAANLNGTGTFKSSGGRLANTGGGSLLFGDFFGSFLRTINPFYESDSRTEIVCSVFPFTFTEGVMASAPTVVVQTDKLNILSRGTIDLETEQLDLTFRTEARRGLGISAGSVVNPFIRIGGTLAAPTLNLDRRGALVTGGAAFFTGGLSLIAQAAVGAAFRSSDPCGNVTEQSRKYLPQETGG